VDIEDRIDLGPSRRVGEVGEMDRVDGTGTAPSGPVEITPSRATRWRLYWVTVPSLGKGEATGGDNGFAREQHVPELAPAVEWPSRPVAPARIDVEAGPVHPVVVGQEARELGSLVDHARPDSVPLDLLEGDHVGLADGVRDPPEVEAAVPALAVLDVLAHEPHRRPRLPVTGWRR